MVSCILTLRCIVTRSAGPLLFALLAGGLTTVAATPEAALTIVGAVAAVAGLGGLVAYVERRARTGLPGAPVVLRAPQVSWSRFEDDFWSYVDERPDSAHSVD